MEGKSIAQSSGDVSTEIVPMEKRYEEELLIEELYLLIVVVLLGISIDCTKAGMNYGIGGLSFSALRFFVAVIVMVILKIVDVLFWSRKQVENSKETIDGGENSYQYNLFVWGMTIGILNYGGTTLMQLGFETVSAEKTGFIIGMNVVLTPVVAWAIGHSVADIKSWIAVVISCLGLLFLSDCVNSDTQCFTMNNIGELYDIASTFCWAFHFLAIDMAVKKLRVIDLSLAAFSLAATLTVITAVFAEPQYWRAPYTEMKEAWIFVVIVGIVEAVAFVVAANCQINLSPVRTTIMISLESVVSAMGGYLFLGETMTAVEVVGAAVMVSAQFVKFIPMKEQYVQDILAVPATTPEAMEDDSREAQKIRANAITTDVMPDNGRESQDASPVPASDAVFGQAIYDGEPKETTPLIRLL